MKTGAQNEAWYIIAVLFISLKSDEQEKILQKSYVAIVSENVSVRAQGRAGMCHNVVLQLNILQLCVSQCSGIPHCAGVCPTIVEKPGARDCAWCDHTDRPHHTTPHHTIDHTDILQSRDRNFSQVNRNPTKDTPLPVSHVCMFPHSSNELNDI